jgi:surface carbohydrate biosynthesis protein
LKKNNNKIFCLDEESTTFFDNFEIYKNQRLNIKNIKILEKFFCLGKEEYLYNKKLYKKHKNKFFLTGNPRFEIDKFAKKIFFNEINKIKKKYKDFILISRSFRYPYKKDKFSNLILRAKKLGIINNKKDLKKYSITRKIRKEMALEQDKLVEYLAREYPLKQIIVRPHPTEDIKKIRSNFKHLKNVNVILEYEAAPWVVSSKQFIHSGCSTAYIALLNNLLPISFLKKKHEKTNKTIPYNLISTIKSDSSVISDNLKNKQKLTTLIKRKKTLSKYIEIFGNSSAHNKIASEVFKSSFETKEVIDKKNLIYEYYYSLKKIFTKFFPENNKQKYIFKNEIYKNINVLRQVFKLNGNYKISCIGNSVYQIKNI